MWLFKNKTFDETPDRKDYIGFVYLITEIDTGKKYVGKKLFHKPTKRTVTLKNGNKRRKTFYIDSDWRNYFGSSSNLQESVAKNGIDKYKREILRLCKKKGELSYYEAKEQFDREVLFSSDYYNEFIGCKIHSKHL
jgi:hypothetical protein